MMRFIRYGLWLMWFGLTAAASTSPRMITGTVIGVNISQETITVQPSTARDERASLRVGCKTVFWFADGTRVGPRPCDLFGFNAETDDLIASLRGKLVTVQLHPFIGALATSVRVFPDEEDGPGRDR